MKENTKILIVCHDSLLYGASQSLLNWIEDMDKNYYKMYEFIFLLPTNKGELYSILVNRGYKVINTRYYMPIWKFDKKSINYFIKNIGRIILNIIFNPLAVRKISEICKKENVKLIHSNSLAAVIGKEVADNIGVNHIWHVREYMEEDHMMKICYPFKNIDKLYSTSYAIFISKAIEKKFILKFIPGKSTVIYNKVKYENNYIKQRLFMEDNICNILIAGKISYNKGQREAILAIDKLNKKGLKVNLYVCGEGEYQRELEKLIDENDINNIKFLGFRKDLKEIRKNIDIALVCSKSEAFGRVTVEAMYYENLVIGANTAATMELIKDGENGYLYKYGDVDDLVSKIENVIRNKERSINIIKYAKINSINKYSNSIYPKILNVYESAVKNNNIRNK